MTMTSTPTRATQRQHLSDLDLTIRNLEARARAAHPRHRHVLTLEAIALDDELWRVDLRSTAHTDDGELARMVDDLERGVERLRTRLQELEALGKPPVRRPRPVAVEPRAVEPIAA